MNRFNALAAAVVLVSSNAFAAAGDVVMNCNDGAMILVDAGQQHGRTMYKAVVQNQGVIDYILGENGRVIQGEGVIAGGYEQPGRAVTKKLSRSVTVSENELGRTLEIGSFYLSSGEGRPSFAMSQWMPDLRPVNGGYKLTIPGFEMTGSHSYVAYEYANWSFEQCSLSL